MRRPRYWPWLLLLIPVAFGLKRLHFDVEVLNLLPPDLKVVQGLKLYQEHFANARELIITVKAANAEKAEETARDIVETLRTETNLVESVVWQPPWMEHPGQAAELIAYLWLNQSPEAVRELTNRLAPTNLPNILADAKEQLASSMSPQEIGRLSYDPFGLTRLPESTAGAAPGFGQGEEMFASPDGSFRIMFVKASHDLATYKECAAWLKQVKATIERAPPKRKDPEIALGYTGRPAFVAEVSGGMEKDITASVGGTAVIIAILFWLAHRRWKPMLWLLTLLTLILGSTLALGGLFFGRINVVSMGFAAILLGLAVDYAVVHYQEALAHPDLTIRQIRRAIAPSIFWAAVTTITAFLVLNFGGLPGLGQLGSLVGLGVGLSACVMIFAFLPPLFPDRWTHDSAVAHAPSTTAPKAAEDTRSLPPCGTGARVSVPRSSPRSWSAAVLGRFRRSRTTTLAVTAALVLASGTVLISGPPRMDPTANALRPRNSQAYAALDEIKNHLNQKREPLWLLVSGTDEAQVGQRLEPLEPLLARAAKNHLIESYNLPIPLWPRPENQNQNRSTLKSLIHERPAFHEVARTNGFAESSLALADGILDTWQTAGATTGTFWPANPMSRWIFEKVFARTPTNFYVLGFINPSTNQPAETSSKLMSLENEIPRENVWLSGWELLGRGIFSSVKQNMWKLIVPMVSLVLLSLLLAFRAWQEVTLSIFVLVLSGICLLTAMRLAGWSWNLLNLMALPLILGTGVDYSIFMQLALRRYGGDLEMAHQSVGRALLLCGGTAIAGFGSLAWSSNAGMASLGQVCAIGIAGNMLISVLLLPVWWKIATRSRRGKADAVSLNDNRIATAPLRGYEPPSQPSGLYRATVWKAGLGAVRLLPATLCAGIVRFLAGVYWRVGSARRQVVIANLLPALGGDISKATRMGRKLMNNFAVKLVDLWRYEAGLDIDDLLGDASGWEHFEHARAQKRGVLLLTPHLGNWEFGGPWLTRRGVALQVITLAEPGSGFTQLRQKSRERWKIQTIVIRNDPFAFVEVIRRLEEGATVALLLDRPPVATAVVVELFGHPFNASLAAAELARASGCVLLPVYLPRTEKGYSAHVLPEVPYDRAALRDRAARQQLTQEIMKRFEPVILEYLDQWYHFVPVWPRE